MHKYYFIFTYLYIYYLASFLLYITGTHHSIYVDEKPITLSLSNVTTMHFRTAGLYFHHCW
jgi:hypothetical protein